MQWLFYENPCITRAVKLFITIFLSCGCRRLMLQKFSAGNALSPSRHIPVPCLAGWMCPVLGQLLGAGVSTYSVGAAQEMQQGTGKASVFSLGWFPPSKCHG